jgi:plasmid stabilization system protein ParE
VYEAPTALLTFPNRGRPGKREDTRELVLAPLPYVVVYTVRDDVVFVVRILHGAATRSATPKLSARAAITATDFFMK